MNIEDYKQRLLELEKDLSTRTQRETELGREQTSDVPGDAGDASVADEAASESFTEAELDSEVLKHVRDALRRIEDGTFGQCIVDGGPIEEKRLDALPWAEYCLKHQTELDAETDRPMPTM